MDIAEGAGGLDFDLGTPLVVNDNDVRGHLP